MALVGLFFAACGSDSDEKDDPLTRIMENRIPEKVVNQSTLPLWLSKFFDGVKGGEYIPRSAAPRAYRFSWRGATYYLLLGVYTPVRLTYIRDVDGNEVELSLEEERDCIDNSRDWYLITVAGI